MRRIDLVTGLVIGLGLHLLAACGGGGDDGDDTGDDAPPPDAAGPAGTVVGGIQLAETRYNSEDDVYALGSLEVRFYDPAPPDFHRTVTTIGACTLRSYTPSSCDPACTDGLCVDDDVCEPYPGVQSGGTLTVTGLTVPLEVEPDATGGYYLQEQLPEDLFDDAAAITAELAGDDLPATTLATTGVPPLETAIGYKITLAPGEDHEVAWTPGGGGRVRLTLNANNQGHGAPFLGIITCEADDAAGAITVPAALVDAFPPTRAWTICAGNDCPPSLLERLHRTTASVGDDRVVELEVASRYYFGVDHLADE